MIPESPEPVILKTAPASTIDPSTGIVLDRSSAQLHSDGNGSQGGLVYGGDCGADQASAGA
jgi:hypothetical protein